MIKLEAPAKYFKAIMNITYDGLTPEETKELNMLLLDNGLSFMDCVNTFTGKTEDTLIYIFN